VQDEIHIKIGHDSDIVTARQLGRQLAGSIGFSTSDQTMIALAISEIARNIVTYASHGELTLSRVENSGRRGISIVATDEGPGIPDLDLAMRDGYSTGKSLGVGLPGARRVVDDFEIASVVGKGTTVTLRKWLR